MNNNQNMNGNIQQNQNMPDNLNNMMQSNMNNPQMNMSMDNSQTQQPMNGNMENANPTMDNSGQVDNRNDFVTSVLADAYMGQENASQGVANMDANANVDYAVNSEENDNVGPTDHLVAPSYVNDPEVLESVEQAKKGSLPVSTELKLVIIISILMLLFIFGFDFVYDFIRNIKY